MGWGFISCESVGHFYVLWAPTRLKLETTANMMYIPLITVPTVSISWEKTYLFCRQHHCFYSWSVILVCLLINSNVLAKKNSLFSHSWMRERMRTLIKLFWSCRKDSLSRLFFVLFWYNIYSILIKLNKLRYNFLLSSLEVALSQYNTVGASPTVFWYKKKLWSLSPSLLCVCVRARVFLYDECIFS